jgi:hypothetical protein
LGPKAAAVTKTKKVISESRVVRWLIFIPKIPIWEGLGMENVGIF